MLPLQKHFLMSCLHAGKSNNWDMFVLWLWEHISSYAGEGAQSSTQAACRIPRSYQASWHGRAWLTGIARGTSHHVWSRAFHSTAGDQGCRAPECSHGSSPDCATAMQNLNVSVPGQSQWAVRFAGCLRGKDKLSLMFNRESQAVFPLMLP